MQWQKYPYPFISRPNESKLLRIVVGFYCFFFLSVLFVVLVSCFPVRAEDLSFLFLKFRVRFLFAKGQLQTEQDTSFVAMQTYLFHCLYIFILAVVKESCKV